MRKKKGFTLVELLAVIVILAIVLIIAVPGVLSIINKTKDNAVDRQKDMIKEASRLYVTSESDVTWVGQGAKMTTVSLDTLKAKGYLDQKIVDPKTKKEITCAKTTIMKNGSKYTYDVTLCDQVNASPRLSSNMIPIVYDTVQAKWLKADYTNQGNSWYDYENQQWANMATVSEATRDSYKKASSGMEVKMDDITGMYVWIPRFRYKLFNVDGTIDPAENPNLAGDYMIDVQLEDVTTLKSTGSQNGEWLTHPAFTFGGEELSGFWIGKFELGYDGASTTTEAEQNQVDPSKIRVKPNLYSWRMISVSHLYQLVNQMSEASFGLTKVEDPHGIKNMEWGAMAYLTNSKYGKTGNANYTGIEKETRLNNNFAYITGCAATLPNISVSTDCNRYETTIGVSASTTGNISGIYDASGGAWEISFGVIEQQDKNGYVVSNSGFIQEQLDELGHAQQYFDTYSYGDHFNQTERGHLGDATIETGPFVTRTSSAGNPFQTSSWYGDNGMFPYGVNSWFVRGGHYDGAVPGVMAFSSYGGNAVNYATTRIVLI